MKKNDSSRRQFLRVAGMGALGFSLQPPLRAGRPYWRTRELLVYVGTYTTSPNSRSEGIYVGRLDLSSGKLRSVDVAKGIVNPSFLTLDRRRRFLYAVNEVNTFNGKAGGAVSSFRIDQKTGALQFLSQQPTEGAGPCHLTTDATNSFLLVANYDGGSVTVLPVRDGNIGVPLDTVQHHGFSVNKERQKAPHAHCVSLDRENRHVFVSDLGLDKILIYEFDSRRGKLNANSEPWVKLKPGAGPRHFTFHPNSAWAYVINELDSTVTSFTYDAASGRLQELQTISTRPADFSGQNSCAEIQAAPSGKFLYGSNRGHDSIVVFSIDSGTGRLAVVQHASTQGKTPRNFAIDPTGEFLLAANQNSSTVVTFRMDAISGKLAPTGNVIEIPTPVCVVISDKV